MAERVTLEDLIAFEEAEWHAYQTARNVALIRGEPERVPPPAFPQLAPIKILSDLVPVKKTADEHHSSK